MVQKKVLLIITIIFLISLTYSSTPGILNVGFDIDDTILFSRDVFLNIPENKRNPIDYGWVNKQDQKLSLLIEPTLDLISYFNNNGHEIYFITARSGENGQYLAKFLSDNLQMNIMKDKNLFFCPKEIINGKRYTTKHHQMKKLKLDLFYGDADTDMIAALKANVHPIRIVRHKKSIEQYGKNYFGNVLQGKSNKSPFKIDDLKIFYSKSVGIYGESIYPIIWTGP
tara:strand:+ start:1516 stop:2193 length:678 start_codon:yes stop_codon:yes gene_type:complete